VIAVRPALEHGNVTLLANRHVDKIETSSTGREVTRVRVTHNGEPEEYSAGVVVVSCGAINSAALLLRSADGKHPNGLANGSDVVGRHYMAHNNSAFVALSKRPNPTLFQKTLGVNDFYFRSDDFEYPMGHIQMLGKSSADMFAADAPAFTPHGALDQMAKHALDLWMTSEDLPDPENRVTLDSQGRIRLSYKENNLEGHKQLVAKLKWMLSHLGCHEKLIPQNIYLGKKIPLAGVAHQNGTIRFGNDPKTSALDTNCKAHELDNLYVVDGSFFVSSTAVNPALTIIANALRVADHLKERMNGHA
jgi:choline dehydrogenase-like flavoprotein